MSKRHEMAISLFVWAGAVVTLLAGLLVSRGTALAIAGSVGVAGIALGVMADRRGGRRRRARTPLSPAGSASLEHDRAA